MRFSRSRKQHDTGVPLPTEIAAATSIEALTLKQCQEAEELAELLVQYVNSALRALVAQKNYHKGLKRFENTRWSVSAHAGLRWVSIDLYGGGYGRLVQEHLASYYRLSGYVVSGGWGKTKKKTTDYHKYHISLGPPS